MDLEYLEELHEEYNSYPLVPEKKMIRKEMTYGFQKHLMEGLNWDQPNSEKLVLTLEDKRNYAVHKNLQFYLKQGMHLKKVHQAIEFEQERWMEPYIQIHTEFRKEVKSDFESNFYKLTNKSVFSKMMENLRNRVDVKIVRS